MGKKNSNEAKKQTLNGESHRQGPLSRNRSASQGQSPSSRKQSLGRSPSASREKNWTSGSASRRASQQRGTSSSRHIGEGTGDMGATTRYKVIRSQPLMDPPSSRRPPPSQSKSRSTQGRRGMQSSRSQSRESLSGYNPPTKGPARQRSTSANSASSVLSKRQSSFTRFDPTEYVRTRERSMEERRRKRCVPFSSENEFFTAG